MYKFHSEHTWIRMDGDEVAIGLTYYAQAHLGEIVYVDLPKAGDRLTAGQVMSGIESSKTTAEIIAPISGLIIESNGELEAGPDLINDSPLERGWITRVRPTQPDEIDLLMDLPAYESYLESIPPDEPNESGAD